MLEPFSPRARKAVALAQEESRRLGHSHVGTEHLLLGLLLDDGSDCACALTAAGATYHGARRKVSEAVGPGEERDGEAPFTPRAGRAIERAFRFSRRRGAPAVEPGHLLLAVLDVEGTAGQVLRGLGVDVARLGDAVDGRTGQAAAAEEAAGEVGAVAAAAVTGPACAACGAGLDATLGHRSVPSRGEAGEPLDVVVAYCTGCGTALGILPG